MVQVIAKGIGFLLLGVFAGNSWRIVWPDYYAPTEADLLSNGAMLVYFLTLLHQRTRLFAVTFGASSIVAFFLSFLWMWLHVSFGVIGVPHILHRLVDVDGEGYGNAVQSEMFLILWATTMIFALKVQSNRRINTDRFAAGHAER